MQLAKRLDIYNIYVMCQKSTKQKETKNKKDVMYLYFYYICICIVCLFVCFTMNHGFVALL